MEFCSPLVMIIFSLSQSFLKILPILACEHLVGIVEKNLERRYTRAPGSVAPVTTHCPQQAALNLPQLSTAVAEFLLMSGGFCPR